MVYKGEPIYRKAKGVDCVEVPDGYVFYDDSRERVSFLNLTAAAVFELCDGENDVAEIAALIQDAFDLSAAPTSEVEACLRSLLLEGLVEPCSASRKSGFFSFLGRLIAKS